jgi:mannosyltransferase
LPAARLHASFARSGSVLLLGVIIACGFTLRLYGLDRESAWLDEAYSITLARGGLAEVFYQARLDVHPPLYYVLLTAWLSVLEPTVWAARLLSVLFSTLAIVAGYAAARVLTSPSTALTTAALLAVSVFQIEFAQEARMYALLTLLATTSTIGFIGLFADAQSRRPALLLYTASASALAYTQVYGLFVVTAQAATVLVDLAVRRRAALAAAFPWLGAMAAALLAFVPWLPTFTWQVSLVQTRFWIAEPEPSGLLAAFERYAGSAELLPIAGAVAVVGLFALLRPQPAAPPRPALAFVLPWLAGPIVIPFALSVLATPIFLPKYTIAASVPFAILVAAGLQALPWRLLRVAASLALIAALMRPLPAYYDTPGKDGWREAVASVEALAASDDAVVLYPYFNTIAFDLYRTRADILVRPFALFDAPPPRDGWPTTVRRATAGRGRVWLVALHADTSSAPVVDALTAEHRLFAHLVRQKIEIFGFERR